MFRSVPTNAPSPRTRRRRTTAGALVAALVAGGMMIPIPAHASHDPLRHVKGTYPNHGFLWLDDLYDRAGLGNDIFVYSDRCKAAEASTWSALNSQLREGQDEFRGAWRTGINFYAAVCTSTADRLTDIMLDYMTASQWSSFSDHGNFGGHHHYSLGDANWCQSFGAVYRCGYHISRIHINEPRFDSYSSTYRVQFLTHETGHSMGFYDYCGHTSVANNGLYCTIRGTWYSVDKKMLRDVVYANSPVHF